MMLLFVVGPDLRFTELEVKRVEEPCDEPETERKSDLIKPSEPLCLILDQPFDCASSTSTLVFAATVLTMLFSVDAPVLILTVLVVLRVVVA
jgi:hypothetical protein